MRHKFIFSQFPETGDRNDRYKVETVGIDDKTEER